MSLLTYIFVSKYSLCYTINNMKSLHLSRPYLLLAIGIPGAGKSMFASKFAKTFNTPFIDYVELASLVDDEPLFHKVAGYTMKQLFLTKQTIFLDGRGDRIADRRQIIDMAHKNGYTPLFIWVQTEPSTAEQRVARGKSAKMSVEQFDKGVLRFQNPTKGEPVLVISGRHTYASQARTVLKKLADDRNIDRDQRITTPPPRPAPVRGRFIR